MRSVGGFQPGARCAVVALAMAIGCASTQERAGPVVRKLEIRGNSALSDRQVARRIQTTKTGWWPFAKKHIFDPVVWATDLRRIKRLYGSRGYYQAEVERQQVTPLPPDGVALEVEVREGKPTHVAKVDVQGLEPLDEKERAALIEALPVKAGDVFTEDDWDAAKLQLRTTLRNRGYARVEVEGAARVDVTTQKADLALAVKLGDLCRFGDIRVDTGGGDTHIPAAWIWEQVRLAIPEGELYSDAALTEAQRRVTGMGVFGAVKVTAGTTEPGDARVPVLVVTKEAPLHELKLGGGLRIDQVRNEGRLIGEWTNRSFLGGMRRLTVHAEAGWAFIPSVYTAATDDQGESRNGPIARLRLDFEQPRFLGRPSLREKSSIGGNRMLEQTYDDLGGQLASGVVWQPRAALTVYPSYHLQGDQLDGPPGAAVLTAPLTLGCETTSNSCFVWLSYLEEVATWDRRDNVLEPRNGWYTSLSLQQGGGPLLGDFDYFRVLPDVRGYLSFGDEDELTLAARLAVGELLPRSGDPNDSAVVTRFYAGGAQSMRGFNDRRLSPLLLTQLQPTPGNPNPPLVTLPIGGNGLVDGSLEARYRITPHLILAAFVDTGQVTEDRLRLEDFAHLLVAVGLGVRYVTPVGPIRVDFARRLEVGRPPPLLAVDAAGAIVQVPYEVNDSCFGLGGSGRATVVPDNLCVLHISIGEAF